MSSVVSAKIRYRLNSRAEFDGSRPFRRRNASIEFSQDTEQLNTYYSQIAGPGVSTVGNRCRTVDPTIDELDEQFEQEPVCLVVSASCSLDLGLTMQSSDY